MAGRAAFDGADAAHDLASDAAAEGAADDAAEHGAGQGAGDAAHLMLLLRRLAPHAPSAMAEAMSRTPAFLFIRSLRIDLYQRS